MNIYKKIFVEFYEFRKKFKTKDNEIWSVSFVTIIQCMQIFCVLVLLSFFGLPNLIVRLLPVIIAGTLLIYILNQAYFFSPSKARALISEYKMLDESQRRAYANYTLVIVILTVISFFVISEIGYLHNK